jgi:PBP1b-binding outer membrane lipoprotein LpoB
MKTGRMLAFALSTILLGGCATPANENRQGAAASAAVSAIPQQSVAAERCLESYRLPSSRHGAFHRAVVC